MKSDGKTETTENKIESKPVNIDEAIINLRMDIQDSINKHGIPLSIAYFVIKEIFEEVSIQHRQNQSEIMMNRANK